MMNKTDRQILNIAIPSIISNITVPLLGLVDVTIVGHMGDAAYIGAIAVGSMIFNVIYWIFGFLRMGTSGMTSQAYGSRNLNEATRLLVRSLTVGMCIGLVFIILQQLVCWGAMKMMRPTDDIMEYAVTYFHICIWGAPAMLGLYSLTGWYIGMQNTRIPMFISIFQNIVNIAASLSFVYGLGMKVDGVAFGTLTAQYGGFILGLIMLKVHYGRLSKYASFSSLLDRKAMMRFFTVNRDIFLRTIFIVAVNMFFTSAGASQGAVILAVNTLLFQLYILFSFVMDGFAYAGEAVGGKYYGAGNKAAFNETKRRIFMWGGAMTVLYTLLYYLGGQPFLGLLTNETSVIAASTEYMLWAVAVPIAGMGAFVWDGIFIGTTSTRGMLISSCISAICFFTVYFLLFPTLRNHALWLALIVYLAMRGIVQTILARRYF